MSRTIPLVHDSSLPDRLLGLLSNDSLAIFLFHGVTENCKHTVRNYTGKHIRADLFAACMNQLASHGHALTMDEALYHCESGVPYPPNSFAITFDDGFENNMSIAAPILSDLGIPAMIYVTTRFVDEAEMSWIDRIECALENALPQTVEFNWAEKPFVLEGAKSRIALAEAVRSHVKHEADCAAEPFADDLINRLGMAEVVIKDDLLDRKMSWDQVREAHQSDLFSIGGHSHTHAILTYLSPIQLANELDTSLSLLKERAGVEPRHYSYPEGLEHCFSQTVIDELVKRGVRCCPTAIEGLNKAGDNPFRLCRIMVG